MQRTNPLLVEQLHGIVEGGASLGDAGDESEVLHCLEHVGLVCDLIEIHLSTLCAAAMYVSQYKLMYIYSKRLP